MRDRNVAKHKVHFSEQQWSDFVRGVSEGQGAREIQAHLASGCDACRATAHRFEAVARFAVADSALPVPGDIVQRAREIFQTTSQSGSHSGSHSAWIDSLQSVVAELVASARMDWQLAGVRSLEGDITECVGDRLLYRAGDYAVDLKLDPPSTGERGELIGQITNERDHLESLADVLVQIVVLGQTLGETATNRFGEFVIEMPPANRKSATLRFALKHSGQRIEIPLDPKNTQRISDP